MAFKRFENFKNPVSSLPDVPAMTSQELKQAFDSNSTELKNFINEFLTELESEGGARSVGIAGTPGSNIEEAIEKITSKSSAALSFYGGYSAPEGCVVKINKTVFIDGEFSRSTNISDGYIAHLPAGMRPLEKVSAPCDFYSRVNDNYAGMKRGVIIIDTDGMVLFKHDAENACEGNSIYIKMKYEV